MDLTPEKAALMAQVIPTLLIVIALEPRLHGPAREGYEHTRYGRWITGTGRELGAIMSLISIGLCLWVVLTEKPFLFATFWVIFWTAWLLLLLLQLFGHMFHVERESSASVE